MIWNLRLDFGKYGPEPSAGADCSAAFDPHWKFPTKLRLEAYEIMELLIQKASQAKPSLIFAPALYWSRWLRPP
jgi:hypothetical protein